MKQCTKYLLAIFLTISFLPAAIFADTIILKNSRRIETDKGLTFTPASNRLYAITVSWSGPGISKKSEFREQVEAMLIEKYGQSVKSRSKIVYKLYDFKITNAAIVSMRPGGASIQLQYLDKRLSRLAEEEKSAAVRSGFECGDKGKF